ncbi:MAG: CDC48 family AAA ATPase, partial [Methanomicrobium sp.]|nr:CDC48 family AAA ATPase [Methanomicrobium sp.]
IEGLPVEADDRVRVMLFGTRSSDFKVLNTSPDGVVVINPATTIKIESKDTIKAGESRQTKISYEDIGGLGYQIQRIREMIELPLKYPQIFERLGIDPPKGVLLYGPPGTGKTLIARAVANETEAYFTSISGPEIMGKFYGESEARLRSIFEDAQKHAPAIIFIDEIDAIAPKREDMGGEKQVERRVVAQLLSLLDGLQSRGQVIVIGATNIPNTLDPALRRPGRFDREIAVPIPDKNGRLHILEIHTRGMPLSKIAVSDISGAGAKKVDLEKLAEITHGFVGADLEALAREAAMSALRVVLPKIDFEVDEIAYEILLGLEATMDDFLEAMKEVEPTAIREVFVEVPDVRWDDVGGLEDIKQELKEAIEWPLKYADVFEMAGTHPPKGILLHGAPGTGKTLLAKAVASETGVNFISVKGPSLISRYIGESEKGIREVFKTAKQASPAIIFFDEIDAIAPRRGSGIGESNVTERVVSQFLAEMDGIEELKGVVILAATNRLDIIDPALLRGGRFDLVMKLPFPDEDARLSIFKIHTKNKPLSSDVDLLKLTQETENIPGSDIEFICRKASMIAVREYINQGSEGKGWKSEARSQKPDRKKEKGKEQKRGVTELKISKRHFEEALRLAREQRDSIEEIE